MNRLQSSSPFRRLFQRLTTAAQISAAAQTSAAAPASARLRSYRPNRRRHLRTEALESRQLLAGDVGMFHHNFFDAEDVNDDGSVSAIDALMVINELNRKDGAGQTTDRQPTDQRIFSDVNNDGQRSVIDALRVINRLNRNGGDPGSRGGANNRPPVAETPIEVRSIDGTGNNLENPELGSAGTNFLQIAAPDYGDGISSAAGEDRPSTRELSNELSAALADGIASERDLSAFLYVWGQFIDHDLDHTSTQVDGETLDIEVPAGDIYFDPTGTGEATIPMSRSVYDLLTGTSTENPRQQVNDITSFLDASMVYGSDQETADGLREFSGGRLLEGEGGLLPKNEAGRVMAGDVRAAENPSLTALQTLFVREHNRLAGMISAEDPSLGDEDVYQRARGIVIAEVQAITFNEFLPALLGQRAISRYAGYDSSVNPSIASEFSTAAFRFGHSTLNDDVGFFDNDGRAVRDELELKDAFFQASVLEETGIGAVLKYDASSTAQEIDLQVVDSLRNFLFGPPGAGGFDLVALNIQRGRDHGLADYNATREAYQLDPVETFADITSDVALQAKLESLYGDVHDIDLWVGLMAEDHLPGSSVGELTSAIIVDQFERIRDGDRLWYENVFRGSELRQLRSTSLKDVIERNTDVQGLQENVFFMKAEVSGRVTDASPVGTGVGGQLGSQPGGRGGVRTPVVGVAGVTVLLTDDAGNVLDTTETDARGNYRFSSFDETGDYFIQLAASTDMEVVSEETLDLLVSNGAFRMRGLDFEVEI